MKERTTFIYGPEDAFDPSQLKIENSMLRVKSFKAAREDRITFSLYELPQELWKVLKQCHELHIRWASSIPYPLITPFTSTVSPGLHIFFTPQKDRSTDLLCPLLRKVFGLILKCTIPEDSFTSPSFLSERFAFSAAYQLYQALTSLEGAITYVQQKVCANDVSCIRKTETLGYADYFDFDYDTISQSVVLSAFWHEGPFQGRWDESIRNTGGSVKKEIGALAQQKAQQPGEISLGGFLAVLGEDEKLNPTLFSFPTRHHLAGANYSTTFMPPTGLHPTLRISLPRSLIPPSPSCALHSYFTIPSYLFVDQYQLSSPNFLASNNLHAIRSLSGETDLEAPDWAVSKWGSTLLLELAPPESIDKSGTGDQWHAELPLHLRYFSPLEAGMTKAETKFEGSSQQGILPVPWPTVFWACASDEGTKMNTNPFDRLNLGFDGLFGPRTVFHHLQPSSPGKSLFEQLHVPTMDLTGARWIERGTVTAVCLGFLWVCGMLLWVVRANLGSKEEKHRKKRD